MMKRSLKPVIFILMISIMTLLFPGTKLYSKANSSTDYFSGVWIASVLNINFPSRQDLSVSQMKNELINILDTAKDTGFKAIFFQVRPAADSLYKSEIFPWSVNLTGKQGKAPAEGFDPLAFICSEAEKRGIEIHAWVNPYRITASPGIKLSDLSPDNPARKNPEIVREYTDGKLYFDPGDPKSVELVVNGVLEIVKNYKVAGIHFDDYFYPGKDFDDSSTYEKYGGGLSLEDFRRQNTYNLIKTVHDEVKKINPNVRFGVSPSGVWANKKSNPLGSDTNGYECYSQSYADTRKWVKDEIIDYIIPQIYWPIGFSACDYEVLAKWWNDVAEGTNVDLYIGHAAYKVGNEGKENWTNPSEIPSQIALNKSLKNIKGSVFYGYSAITDNKLGLKDNLKAIFSGENNDKPDNDTFKDLVFSYPQSGSTVDYDKSFVIGTADPRIPIYLNGKPIDRTPSGHFEVYLPLEVGKNTFTFSYNNKDYKYTLIRKSSSTKSEKYKMTKLGFKSDSLEPSEAVYLKAGESLNLSAVAPSGATVTAKINGTVVILNQGDKYPTSGGLALSKYTATYTIPSSDSNNTISLGKPEYTVSKGGKTVSETAKGEVFCVNIPNNLTAVIKEKNTIMRSSNSSSSEMLTPLEKGVTDYIVHESASYYKLRYGGWTLKENVDTIYRTLRDNKITSVRYSKSSKTTNIGWKMPIFVPYTIKTDSEGITITFHNTIVKKAFDIPKSNPLFSSITFKQSGNDAIYRLTYKRSDGLYGYRISYKWGRFIISFKNPPKIKSGSKPLTGKIIIVDAGHGGTDPGAMGPEGPNGRNEKDLNLSVALSLQKQLEKLGAYVVMTRSDDRNITLKERNQITYDINPDFIISIHHNSLNSNVDIKNYSGLLTLYTKEFSKRFAQTVHNSLKNNIDRKSMGVKYQSLAVCRVTEAPAILLELGFISNPYEFENLSNPEIIEKEAKAIAQGIIDFCSE